VRLGAAGQWLCKLTGGRVVTSGLGWESRKPSRLGELCPSTGCLSGGSGMRCGSSQRCAAAAGVGLGDD
jgi:hypothetical protein